MKLIEMTKDGIFIFVAETDKDKITEYKNRGFVEVKKESTDNTKKKV